MNALLPLLIGVTLADADAGGSEVLAPVEVVLVGQACDESRCRPLRFTWAFADEGISGTIRVGDQPPFHLVQTELVALTQIRVGERLMRARYRLRYAVDECERREPEPREVFRWDPCLYHPGETQPVYLRWSGDVMVDRERVRLSDANVETFTAAGISDDSLLGVLMAKGVARQLKVDGGWQDERR